MAPDTAFYDQRAASYAAASHDMDLRPLYARFLPHVRPGGLILDAGCGSGRDALVFRQAGFRVETDLRNEKIGKKIREAQMEKVPYMLVVGDKEAENGTVAVRARSGAQSTMLQQEFEALLRNEVDTKTREQAL